MSSKPTRPFRPNSGKKEVRVNAGSSRPFIPSFVPTGKANPVNFFMPMQKQQQVEYVKLFVGQVPRSWDEKQLRHLFRSFGSIAEVAIIRERNSRRSKGCGFVNFYELNDAQRAIDVLHNTRACGAMSNPLQVRFASGTKYSTPHRSASSISTKQYNPDPQTAEFKLFIGMIPKTITEEDLHNIFNNPNYGEVDEITILRDADLQSKGCAFLRMKTIEQAERVRDHFNNRFLFADAPHASVIKFADSDREKKVRRMHSALRGLTLRAASEEDTEHYENLYEQSKQLGIPPPTIISPDNPGQEEVLLASMTFPFERIVHVPQGAVQFCSVEPLIQLNSVKDFIQGPKGANILIGNIPNEFSDLQLGQIFSCFGTVLSAKILILDSDAVSPGLSKRNSNILSQSYGLISFNSAEAVRSVMEFLTSK
ncbi:hypothetical protein PCE1_003160 [Barthelona sp. PCE]